MKKIYLLIVTALIMVSVTSCGLVVGEDHDAVEAYIQQNATTGGSVQSKFFVDSMDFSGDLEVDFGSNRIIYSDPTNDSTSSLGKATLAFHELSDIYFAVDMDNIYIGFKSSRPDGSAYSFLYSGGSYIYIDNGITNATNNYSTGVKLFNSSGVSAAGLGGDPIEGWDETSIEVTNDHKISLMIKHYRPAPKDVKIYACVNGVVEKNYMGYNGSSVSWKSYTTDSVSEFQVPISYLFGPGMVATNIPDFYLAFRVDDALTADNMGKSSDPNAVAIDWVPNQVNSETSSLYYAEYIFKWIKISVLDGIALLDIAKPTIGISSPITVVADTNYTTNVSTLNFSGSFDVPEDYSSYKLSVVVNGFSYSPGVGSGQWVLFNQYLSETTNEVYAVVEALNGSVWVTNRSKTLTIVR